MSEEDTPDKSRFQKFDDTSFYETTHSADDPLHRERNPMMVLFLILLGFFVVGILAVIFYPRILDMIFGNFGNSE